MFAAQRCSTVAKPASAASCSIAPHDAPTSPSPATPVVQPESAAPSAHAPPVDGPGREEPITTSEPSTSPADSSESNVSLTCAPLKMVRREFWCIGEIQIPVKTDILGGDNKDFVPISRQARWLRSLCGNKATKYHGILWEIQQSVKDQRGKRVRTSRKVDTRRQAQPLVVEVDIRGRTLRVTNDQKHLMMEANEETLNWLVATVKTDFVKNGLDVLSPSTSRVSGEDSESSSDVEIAEYIAKLTTSHDGVWYARSKSAFFVNKPVRKQFTVKRKAEDRMAEIDRQFALALQFSHSTSLAHGLPVENDSETTDAISGASPDVVTSPSVNTHALTDQLPYHYTYFSIS